MCSVKGQIIELQLASSDIRKRFSTWALVVERCHGRRGNEEYVCREYQMFMLRALVQNVYQFKNSRESLLLQTGLLAVQVTRGRRC